MAVEIQEKLQVQAPIEDVWKFVTDPETMVVCMPGATLDEKVDDENFVGNVKVKLGAITTGYQGKIHFARVDPTEHVLEMTGVGKEKGGGTAKAQIAIALAGQPDGATEMTIDAKVDLTGRVMQVGRGMIKGVSHQLFLQFAEKAKSILESAAAGEAGTEGAAAVPATVDEAVALDVGKVVTRTIWAAIVSFFKRLFRRLFRRADGR